MRAQTLNQRTPAVEAPSQGWSNPCIPPELARGKAKVRLYHALAPNCWWSWGYYGTLSRIRLTYGNQVDLKLALFPVYTDLKHHLAHNGMDLQGWKQWAIESAERMGVPIFTNYPETQWAQDSTPAVLGGLAAYRQGEPQGERFVRALLRRSVVEGRDAASPVELRAAAEESGLDLARFEADLADRARLKRELAAQQERMPGNVALGFYNLVLEDERGRRVVLDHAFDPADALAAIEFLSGGGLVKNVPTDPVAFLNATGPAPTSELARAFSLPPEAMTRRLRELENAGTVRRVTLANADHWTVA